MLTDRIHDEIAATLADFGIEYEDIQRSNNPAVQFMLNGKRIVFPYCGSDPSSWVTATASLRSLLLSAGAKLKPKIPEKPVVSAEEEELTPSKKPTSLPVPDVESPVIKNASEPELPAAKINDNDTYLTYASRQLIPGRVIVIELQDDIVAEAGSVLIVPLHKPNTIIPMSRKLFEATFIQTDYVPKPELVHVKEQVKEADPLPEPKIVAAPSVLELPLPTVKPVVLPAMTEPAETSYSQTWARKNGYATPPVDPPVVHKIPEGVSSLTKKKRAYNRAPNTNTLVLLSDNPLRKESKPVEGITPQLGRILVAMDYVVNTSHKVDIMPSMLNDVLSPSDRKQYAARMPRAIDLGLVKQGLPLLHSRGYHVKLTQLGVKVAKKLKDWPWIYDGLNAPDWVPT